MERHAYAFDELGEFVLLEVAAIVHVEHLERSRQLLGRELDHLLRVEA